jgi:hypothetical protein
MMKLSIVIATLLVMATNGSQYGGNYPQYPPPPPQQQQDPYGQSNQQQQQQQPQVFRSEAISTALKLLVFLY